MAPKGSINLMIMIILSLLVACSWQISGEADDEAEAAFESIIRGNEKLATIHLYVQETLSGPTATLYEVARASITADSPTAFGLVRVADDLVTAGPERNSTVLGRLQGVIVSSDLQTSAQATLINLVFTAGEYNGSTISILGRNQVTDLRRERPVVGGTGVFRFSRGYDISSVVALDTTGPGYLTIERTIYATYVDI